MLRRRKPVVILLSAEELALLAERAAEHEADIYDYAQQLFLSALGISDEHEVDPIEPKRPSKRAASEGRS